MIFYVYKITNTINNKIYIGVHSTNNIDDGYMGSGMALAKAFKKYGKENFYKEILEYCDDQESLYKREAEIVNKEFINRNDTYNLQTGGKGGLNNFNQSDELIKRKAEAIRASGIYGRGTTTNKIRITDGVFERFLNSEDAIPINWHRGVSDMTKALISITLTQNKTKHSRAKYARQVLQKKWDNNPEEFEKVKQKRLATQEKHASELKEKTGFKHKLAESASDRREHARKAAMVRLEKMKNDPEYKKRILAKREETRKRNQVLNGYKQKPKEDDKC
jgi:hypothetical protein